MLNAEFIGHSCFLLTDGKDRIIIDPFIKNNPLTDKNPADIEADYILLTHGHVDHFGDTIEIAENNDSLIIAPNELAKYCGNKGLNAHPMHIGGGHEFDFGYVKLTKAFHGSALIDGENITYLGSPCGFLIDFADKLFYHAGDTGLFGDMELLGERYEIDIAALPIGSNFTMDVKDGIIAADMLNPKNVIPIHFNTFDLINQDPEQFRKGIEDLGNRSEVVIINPGERKDFE